MTNRKYYTCTVDECEIPSVAKGMCKKHYMQRWHEADRMGAPRILKRQTGVPCDISGCVRLSIGDGLCRMHYERRRKGRPIGGPMPQRNASGEGTIHPTGYRSHSRNGKVTLEHRHVMEQSLGRSLLPHETVHHRNGQRSQNDIANLELWSTAQPSGQRVADKVAWAREILTTYGEMFPE